MKTLKIAAASRVAALIAALLLTGAAQADDRATIDANTQRAVTWLHSTDPRLGELMQQAAGVLVFPDMVKMGFGVGGEFGEGALLVKGQTEGYYATAGTEFGLAPEAGGKAKVIFFMTEESLRDFRGAVSLDIGEHLAVPVITGIEGGTLQSVRDDDPVVGVILSGQGLVSDLQLHGDRITRIAR